MNNDTTTCPGDDLLMAAVLSTGGGQAPADDVRRALDHARDCGPCGKTLDLYASLRRANRGSGAHTDGCLDENALAEFVDGAMPWEERVTAESHLAACGKCAHNLAELHTLLVALRPAQTAPQLVLAWVRDGLNVISAAMDTFTARPLAAVPVLDRAQLPKVLSWSLESGSGPVQITVQHDAGGTATLRLVLAPETAAAGRCRVHLKRAGSLLESRTVDPSAAVEFPELVPADYQVEMVAAGSRTAFQFTLTPED